MVLELIKGNRLIGASTFLYVKIDRYERLLVSQLKNNIHKFYIRGFNNGIRRWDTFG